MTDTTNERSIPRSSGWTSRRYSALLSRRDPSSTRLETSKQSGRSSVSGDDDGLPTGDPSSPLSKSLPSSSSSGTGELCSSASSTSRWWAPRSRGDRSTTTPTSSDVGTSGRRVRLAGSDVARSYDVVDSSSFGGSSEASLTTPHRMQFRSLRGAESFGGNVVIWCDVIVCPVVLSARRSRSVTWPGVAWPAIPVSKAALMTSSHHAELKAQIINQMNQRLFIYL